MLFSKKNYKVSLHGTSGVVYQENGKSVLIEAELMTGSTDLVIYLDSFISWQAPHESEEVTWEDKLRVRENITRELKAKGVNIDWE